MGTRFVNGGTVKKGKDKKPIKGKDGKNIKCSSVKYQGIQEYYKDSDPDKTTIAHYISYWAADASHKNGGTTKKERVDTLDPNEALGILNKRKAESEKKKKEREELQEIGHGSVLTIDQVATEYFKERKKIGNIEKDMKRYVKHIGNSIYKTVDTNSGKGYKLLPEVKTYIATVRGRGEIVRLYQRAADDAALDIGANVIADLDANMIKRLINALEKKGLGDKTVSSVVNLLKAINNHAISEGYVVKDPFKNKKTKVEVTKEDRKRLLTTDERRDIFIQTRHDIKKLDKDGNQVFSRGKPRTLYKGDKRVFMLFKMLYFTGQRPKSIIDLRVKDIDLKQRQISIDSIKEQSGTFVPISDKLYPLLKIWIKDQDMDKRLFDISYQTFADKAKVIFAKYNKGLDSKTDSYRWASMYSFRHTSATVMLAKTNNIKTVQTVLNHSDPKVTAIYAKLLNDAKMEGVNVL